MAKLLTTAKGCFVLNNDAKIFYQKKREFKKSPYITREFYNSVGIVDGVHSAKRAAKKITVEREIRPQSNNRILVKKTSVFLPRKFVKNARKFESVK